VKGWEELKTIMEKEKGRRTDGEFKEGDVR
jgi:hypothetical protein